MAVDVSKIPNNSKFDPVREAILNLQAQIGEEGQIAYDGTLTIGTSGNLTGSGTFTANQSGDTTITIGIDDSGYATTDDLDDYLSLIATGTQTITSSVVISGDFTVNGTTTYLNTETVRVEDNIIELNRTPDTPNDTATAATSGIEIYRGNAVTPASFIFNDADDTWDLTNNLAVTGTITTGGDEVATLGSFSVTPLDPVEGSASALIYNEGTGVFEYRGEYLTDVIRTSDLTGYLEFTDIVVNTFPTDPNYTGGNLEYSETTGQFAWYPADVDGRWADSGIELGDSVDLNTIRDTGLYSQNSNSQAAAGSNYPTDFAGILLVYTDKGNGLHTSQTYYRYNTREVWHRYYYNGDWQDWEQYITTTNIASQSVNYATTSGSADEWTNARTVTFSGGDVTGSFSIDGSADVNNVNLQVANDSHTHDGRYYTETESDARFTKYVDLTSEVQLSSYRRSVIALCDVDNTEISRNSYSIGTLTFHRENGLSAPVKLDIAIEKRYNTDGTNVVALGIGGDSFVDNIQYVTFDYGGNTYGGIEFYFTAAHHHEVTFYGRSNFDIFGLDYYNTNGGTVLNSEVYNSLSSANVSLETDFFFNNQAVFHEGYHPNADTWTTPRTITLGGDLTGSVTLDGSSDETLSAQVVNDSHTHDLRYYTKTESEQITARALGWVPAYDNNDESTVFWNETEQAVQLYSGTDTTIGMAYKAIRMKAGDKVRVTVMVRSAFAATSGLYLRLYFYNGNLPDGKTHVSNDAIDSTSWVQEDSSGDSGWWENDAIGTDWTNFERTYTAPADGYMSLVILNWSGLGTGAIYVKQPDIQFEKVNQAASADSATSADNADTVDNKHATDFNFQYITDNGATTTNTITVGGSSSGALASNKQGIVIEGTGGRLDNPQDGTERLPTLQFFDSVTNYGSNTATAGELRGGVEWYTSETSSNLPAISGAIYSVNENTYNTQMGLGFYTNYNQTAPTEKLRIGGAGEVNIVSGDLQIGGTVVIDSSRNAIFASVSTGGTQSQFLKADGSTTTLTVVTQANNTPASSGALFYDTLTGDLEFTPPNLTGLATTSQLNGYLPLSGGTVTNLLTTNDLTVLGTFTASNVDASTLDSLDSTQFLRSDADDTATGMITINSTGGGVLRLQNNDTSNTQNQTLGSIVWNNQDGSSTGPNNAAIIEAQTYGTLGQGANLLFKTVSATTEGGDATTSMTLFGDGVASFNNNVGIGTTSPQAPLHVIAAGTGDDDLIQEWSYNANDLDKYSLMLKQTVTSGVVRYNFSMVNNNTAYNDVLVLDRGNVGIGNVSPQTPLHVYHPTQNLVSTFESGDSDVWIDLRDNAASTYGVLIGAQGGDFRVAPNNNDVFRIKSTGEVGIKTTSPRYQLDLAIPQDSSQADYIALGVYNGPSGGGGTTLGSGLIWKANYSGYTKRSAGIVQIAESNYFQSGLAFYTNGTADATTDWVERMYLSAGGILQMNRTTGQPTIKGSTTTGAAHLIIDSASSSDAVFIQNYNSGNVYLATGGGSVGIGTTSPAYPLDVTGRARITDDLFIGDIIYHNGDTNTYMQFLGDRIRFYAGGVRMLDMIEGTADRVIIPVDVSIANTADPAYALDVGGTIRASSDIIAFSDARVKENVKTIDNALDKVTQLRGVSYNKIGETEEKIGVIAQEIEKVLPQVVQEDDEGMKSVAYGNIVGVLIEAIKEQQKQIDELKARLDGSTK